MTEISKRVPRTLELLDYHSGTFAQLPFSNLDDAGKAITSIACSVLNCRISALLIKDDNDLKLLASKGLNKDLLSIWNSREILLEHLWKEISCSRLIVCNSLESAIAKSARLLGLEELFLSAPLNGRIDGGQEEKIGLVIASKPRHNFDHEIDIAALSMIASNAASGILNCISRKKILGLNRSLEVKNLELERHRERLEEKVAERTAKLERQMLEARLLQGAAEVAAKDAFDEALQHVVDLVCQLFGWPVGHVYELSPEDKSLLLPTTIWYLKDSRKYATFREVTEKTNFKIGVGLPGRILENGQPAWIVNVHTDENFPRNRLAANLGVKGAYGCPVKIGEEIVAVLEFFADEEEEPDNQLLQIMRSIGLQLGILFERNRAEEALRQSEQELRDAELRFRSIAQSANDAIISADSTGHIIFWNKCAQTIFGYSEKEALGQPLTILMPERHKEPHNKGLHRFVSTGQSRLIGQVVELHGLRKDGTEFPLELTLASWQTDEGRFVTGIMRDITKRKQEQEALRKSEDHLRKIFEYSNDAIFIIDPERDKIVDVNPRACSKLGYPREELLSLPMTAIHPNEMPQLMAFSKSVLEQGEGWTDELSCLTKSGSTIPVEISSSVIEIDASPCIIALVRDITERKEAEAALRQAEKMAALGQLIAGVAHEVNTPLGAIRSSVGNISTTLGQVLLQLPDFYQKLSGEEQLLFVKLLEVSLDNKTILTSKEARRVRRALARDLDDAGVKVSNAAADTLVDMGIVKNFHAFLPLIQHTSAREILEMAYKLTGLKRNAENITTAADKAAKVVFALKSYSHHEISSEKIQANIVDGIETILTLYHNQIKQGVEVVRNFQQVEPILCYPDELNQVWTNLLHNSLQAMDGKGTLTIGVHHKKNFIVVSINDSGKGIPGDIKDKIFQPFFTTKRAGEGSGLGLDIVRKILEKHDGKIEVESEPGTTTFSVFLPASN